MKKTLLLVSFVSLNAFAFAQCGQRYHDKIFQDSTVSNITYGSNTNRLNQNETLRLDIHFPKSDQENARPLVILAHGGNFLGGSKTGTDVLPMAKDLARMGYVVSSIDYRVGMTNFPFPGPDAGDATEAVMRAVHDARAAVRFFRASYESGNPYGIDTSKIFFAGVSAGGFMALHLAYLDEMSEYPPQVDTVGQFGLNGGIQGLSGSPGYSSKVRAVINIAGAIGDTAWIKSGDEPVLNFHGTNDQTVPYGSDTIRLLGVYPLLKVHGGFSVDHKADLLGITNCFEIYEGQNHVPHVSNSFYYDTTLNITRNFLAHFVCNEMLNCAYGPQITAVEENSIDLLNAYPNPTNDAFELILEGFNGNVNITLVDLSGKTVRDFYCSGNRTRISRDGLSSGIYLIRAESESKSAYTRIVFH